MCVYMPILVHISIDVHSFLLVPSQRADLAAAPMTVSAARREVIDFTEPYMTFHTTILMKTSPAKDGDDISSVEDLVNQSEVKYGLLKDGITENFFKYTSNALYRKMWRAIQVCAVRLCNLWR